MTLKAENIEELPKIAEEFLRLIGNKKIVIFDAPMGAGKTTFISAICRYLGVEDDISSPTFSIVNEYRSKNQTIYHFDCYRLESIEEALDMGVEEYLESGNLCLIEWPDIIEPFLPEDTIRLEIMVNDDGSREFRF